MGDWLLISSVADVIMNEFQILVQELELAEKMAAHLRCRAFEAQTNVELLRDAVHVAEVTGIVKHPVLVG